MDFQALSVFGLAGLFDVRSPDKSGSRFGMTTGKRSLPMPPWIPNLFGTLRASEVGNDSIEILHFVQNDAIYWSFGYAQDDSSLILAGFDRQAGVVDLLFLAVFLTQFIFNTRPFITYRGGHVFFFKTPLQQAVHEFLANGFIGGMVINVIPLIGVFGQVVQFPPIMPIVSQRIIAGADELVELVDFSKTGLADSRFFSGQYRGLGNTLHADRNRYIGQV